MFVTHVKYLHEIMLNTKSSMNVNRLGVKFGFLQTAFLFLSGYLM